MLEMRCESTCAAVGGCVIVAGGSDSTAAVDVYEEALGRWRRLPCNLPHGRVGYEVPLFTHVMLLQSKQGSVDDSQYASMCN
jgi:hypothetical protein